MISGDVSARSGFTATFDTVGGELVTAHRSGGVKREMFAALCDEVVARWPAARLVAYSTPRTVLVDLAGSRRGNKRARSPEVMALAAIGRRELLSPALEPVTREGRRMRGWSA